MTRISAVRHIALLLVLSLSGIGAVGVPHACGGACCAPRESGAQGAQRALQAVPAEHACCCGDEAAPCDMEEAPAPQGPHSALSATPRVEVPSQAVAVLNPDAKGPVAACAGRIARGAPTAQAPPGPTYLRYLSLLC